MNCCELYHAHSFILSCIFLFSCFPIPYDVDDHSQSCFVWLDELGNFESFAWDTLINYCESLLSLRYSVSFSGYIVTSFFLALSDCWFLELFLTVLLPTANPIPEIFLFSQNWTYKFLFLFWRLHARMCCGSFSDVICCAGFFFIGFCRLFWNEWNVFILCEFLLAKFDTVKSP